MDHVLSYAAISKLLGSRRLSESRSTIDLIRQAIFFSEIAAVVYDTVQRLAVRPSSFPAVFASTPKETIVVLTAPAIPLDAMQCET